MKPIFIAVLFIFACVGFVLFFVSNEDVVQEVPVDTEEQVAVPEDIQNHIDSKADLIQVASPAPLDTVTSPLTLTGVARGYWFFEASFPIVVTDWNGLIIGEGYATAVGDWMTEEFVPFTSTVSFDVPVDTPYKRGTIIFQKDNPSGLPERDDALEIPVQFR
jgi:hypothetical protein